MLECLDTSRAGEKPCVHDLKPQKGMMRQDEIWVLNEERLEGEEELEENRDTSEKEYREE